MHFCAILISHCLWSIFLTSETLASDQCWAEKTRTFISFRLLFFCFGFSSSSLPFCCFSSSLVLTSGCDGRKYLKHDSYCSMLVNWSTGDHRDILVKLCVILDQDSWLKRPFTKLNQTMIFKKIEWFCALLLRAGCSTMAFKPHVRPSCFISSRRALNLPDIS